MLLRLLFQKLESMDANENVSISVDFQEISIQRVEPEAANREGRVVVEQHDLCWWQLSSFN